MAGAHRLPAREAGRDDPGALAHPDPRRRAVDHAVDHVVHHDDHLGTVAALRLREGDVVLAGRHYPLRFEPDPAVDDGALRPVEVEAVHEQRRGVHDAAQSGDPADPAALEAQVDDEVVFLRVVLRDAAAQAVAVHLVDVAEEPAQRVDRVAGAAQQQVLRHLGPPRSAGVDRAQVVDVGGLAHEQVAYDAGIAQPLRLHVLGVAAHRLCDEQHETGAVDRLDDTLRLLDGVDHRLGHHDVLAGVQRRHHLVGVERPGRVDAHHVYVVALDQLAEIGGRPGDAVLRRGGRHPVFVHVADRRHAHRDVVVLG